MPKQQHSDVILENENVLAKLIPTQGDVSNRATTIARLVDRLPPGQYTIEISKFEIKGQAWKICAWERQRIFQKDVG